MDRSKTENDLLVLMVRLSQVRYGELCVSVWDGAFMEVHDRHSRRATDAPYLQPHLDKLSDDRQFRAAAAALATLYQARYAVFVIRVADARYTHIECHRVPSPGDDDTERRRRHLSR